MNREIDDRVVSIEFDNSRFSENVDDTLKGLDALEQKLEFKSVADGFSRITQAADNVTLSGISNGVEALQNRFSTMGIVGMRIIERLTDSMINLASKGINFAVDSIFGGGTRRAMNLENAKFTLDGLLKDDEKVAAVMANVQESVDGTAYGLDAAAVVASQLAASGMEAGDNMLHSLKAISGVAAMTNSEFSEIGHIFTTIAGNGKVMTEQLNQFSYRGLNAAAVLAEQMGKTEQEIREMVSDGKISFQDFSDAMNDAFGEQAKKANETFTGSLSNVKSALGRIGAKFVAPLVERNGPVVKVFNALRLQINSFNALIDPFVSRYVKVVNSLANFLVKGLDNFDRTGASVRLLIEPFQVLENIFKALWSVLKPIGQAFKDVFGNLPSDRFVLFINGLKKLTEGFILNKKQAENLRNTFKGIFSLIDAAVTIVYELASGFIELLRSYDGVADGFFGVTGQIGKFINKTVEAVKSAGVLKTVINGVVSVIGGFGKVLGNFGDLLSNIFSRGTLEVFGSIFNSLIGGLTKAMGVINQCIGTIKTAFAEIIRSGDAKSIMDLLNAGFVTVFLNKLKTLLTQFVDMRDVADQFWRSMRRNFGGLNSMFFSLRNTLNALVMSINYKALKNIAIAVGILAASCLILANIPKDDLTHALVALTIMFGVLIGSFSLLNKNSGGLIKAYTTTSGLTTLAAALLVMSFAFAEIAKVVGEHPDSWIQALIALGVMMGLMTGMSVIMSTNKVKMKGAFQFIELAGALIVIGYAIKQVCDLSPDQFKMGIKTMGALILMMLGIMAYMNSPEVKLSKVTWGCRTFLVLALALGTVANAMKKLGGLTPDELEKGAIALIVVIGTMGKFSKLMTDDRTIALLEAAGSIVLMSEAIQQVALVSQEVSKLSWPDLGKAGAFLVGFFGIITAWSAICAKLNGKTRAVMFEAAGALIVFGIGVKSIAKTVTMFDGLKKGTVTKAVAAMAGMLTVLSLYATIGTKYANDITESIVALLAFSIASRIIASVCNVFTKVTWGGVARAIVGIGGIAAIMMVMAHTIGKDELAKNIFIAAGAIAALGIALTIMAPALAVLGTVGILGATAGLAGIAVGMAAIGFVASKFSKAIPFMYDFAAVMVILSLALTVASIGLSELSFALISFSSLSAEQADRATEVIKKVLAGIGLILVAMSGFAYLGVTSGVFKEAMPIILQFAATILMLAAALGIIALSLVAVAHAVKQFATISEEESEAAGKAFLNAVKQFGDGMKEFMKNSAKAVLEFFKTIFDAGPEFFEGLKNFLLELIKTIGELAPEIAQVIVDVLLNVLEIVAENSPRLFAALWDIILGLLESAENAIDPIIDKVFDILKKVLESVKGNALDILGTIANDIGQTIGELIGNIIGGLMSGIIEGAGTSMESIGDKVAVFSDSLVEFLDMCRNVDDGAMAGAERLCDIIDAFGNVSFSAAVTALDDWILGGTLSESMVKAMGWLGDALKAFKDSIDGLSSEDIARINVASTALAKIIGMVDQFRDISTLTGKETDGFLSDVKSINSETISSQFSSAVSTAEEALKELRPKLVEVGKYCVDGFVEGLTDAKKVLDTKNAAFSLGKVAETAIRNATGVESPSRILRLIGGFCVEGFALGLGDNLKLVTDSATTLGDTAISATETLAGRIQTLMDSDSMQPVITPVLDLSQIQNGANGISAMFDNPNLGFNATFNATNDQTNAYLIEQNNLLREMITAINSGGNVYIKDGPLIGWIDTKLGALT